MPGAAGGTPFRPSASVALEVEGRPRALKVGMWKAVAGILKLQPENYQFRGSQRGDCWELYNIYVVTSG